MALRTPRKRCRWRSSSRRFFAASGLLAEGEDWSETELVRWLNVELHKGRKFLGLTAAQSAAWLRRAVAHLVGERNADMGILVRKRHALADALIPRVAQHGRQQVRKAAELLIAGAGKSRLETSAEHALAIEEHKYAPYDTYRGAFMTCGHCGKIVTGEQITKKTKSGERRYIYYRCSRYTAEGHPRVRLSEKKLDDQLMAIFDSIRLKDESVREWFRVVLASQTRDEQAEARAQRSELQRQSSLLVEQQDRLLNLRLAEEVDQDTFARKHTELRERLASIKLQLDVADRSHDETADLASKAFELSQTLQDKWVGADYATKRRLLEIVCLNCRLDGVNLVPTMRKPFDVLAEGLDLSKSRGERIRTSDLLVPNETRYQAALHPGKCVSRFVDRGW